MCGPVPKETSSSACFQLDSNFGAHICKLTAFSFNILVFKAKLFISGFYQFTSNIWNNSRNFEPDRLLCFESLKSI